MMIEKRINLLRSDRPQNFSRGFTLVELLVVIAIMGALTALMLPRLRTVNQDRNIREAARVLGSKFAEASQRAIEKGSSALTIVKNPNFVDAQGVEYAGTQIYLSRAVPSYVGDSAGAVGTMMSSGGTYTFNIDMPAEQTDSNIIRVGDQLRVSRSGPASSTVPYTISGLAPSGARLILTLDYTAGAYATKPAPPVQPGGMQFVIDRQPKRLESSVTDLPPGYVIDLRASGDLNLSAIADTPTAELPGPRTVFHEPLKTDLPGAAPDSPLGQIREQARKIDIFFDSTGSIASIRRYAPDWGTSGSTVDDIQTDTITGPLFLFVRPSELDGTDSPLFKDANLWVTVNNTTGGVNIGYNNPPLNAVDDDGDGEIELHEMLPVARTAAQSGGSAAQ